MADSPRRHDMARIKTGQTTKDLIDAALQAQTAFDAASDRARQVAAQAQAAIQQAQADLQAAQANLAAANLALHDELAQNGPACVIDDSVTPPVVTLYTAQDPDSWSAMEIRVAA